MTLPERNSDGKLPAFAWPGGYPILYWTKGGDILCPGCATKSADDASETGKYKVYTGEVYWEGPDIACDRCDTSIGSAYGEPPECTGHPAGPCDPMGETVYCDGTCKGVNKS